MPTAMVRSSLDGSLAKRYYCDFDGYCYKTSWDTWGRWVAFAVAAMAVALLAFLFSCQSNRRRRHHGLPPMYGTGWLPGAKYTGSSDNNIAPYQSHNIVPPPYAPPFPQKTYNSNEGYYTHQAGPQIGIELQPPQSSYQPPRVDDAAFTPPLGPPPGREEKTQR